MIAVKLCRCACGYRCGGPGKCQLSPMECLRRDDGEHYVRDCDHRWDGETHEGSSPSGGYFTSPTCSRCGMTELAHHFATGP